jgi:hypothetical protein
LESTDSRADQPRYRTKAFLQLWLKSIAGSDLKMTREMIPSAWNDPHPSPETKEEGPRNKKGGRIKNNNKITKPLTKKNIFEAACDEYPEYSSPCRCRKGQKSTVSPDARFLTQTITRGS